MLRRFAIASVVLAIALTVFGRVQASDDSPTAGDATIDVTRYQPVQGLKPLPEVIEFWRSRSEQHPSDYYSRTNLGYSLVSSASEAADLDRYADAEAAFRQALAVHAGHADARLGLATTLIAQHEFAGALEHTSAVLQENPGSLDALAVDGDANLGIGRYEAASIAYEELVDSVRSAATVSRLARLRWLQGDPDAAIELANEAVDLTEDAVDRASTRAFYRFQLGHFLFAAGRNDEAIASYLDALGQDPEHPGASEGLAFALAAVGRHEEAAGRYRELLERSPAADLHASYAEVLDALGRADEAAEQERLGAALATETIDSYPAERRHLVSFYLTREPDLAVKLARTDLADRQDVGAYDTLAWALFHAGEVDEAAAVIETAMAFGVQDAAIHYHAAAIAAAVGDDATALRLVTAALDINPQFHPTEAADARELQATL